NTRMVDRMYARQQLIKYLEEIQPQDRIGVYVFGGRLRVLHEYTADMADFQKKLADAKSRLINVSGTETPGALDREQSEFDSAFAGRENLIWVSGAFPMIFGYQTMENMAENYEEEVDATVRALSQANVAVYPIDARGLTTPPGFDASRGSQNTAANRVQGPPAGSGGLPNRPGSGRARVGGNSRQNAAHATMDEIAQRTGGHAYYNTNDIARAIHDAVVDSTLTYTIGFYPTDEKNDRDFHKIKIETQRHVSLHYRSGYLDVPVAPQDERQRMLQLHDALFSPMDAT